MKCPFMPPLYHIYQCEKVKTITVSFVEGKESNSDQVSWVCGWVGRYMVYNHIPWFPELETLVALIS